MVVDGEENGKGKKEGLQSLVERKTISLSLSCKTENNIQDNILQVNPGKPKDIEDGLATRNARWGNNKTTSLTLNLADVWIIGGSSCRKTNNYPDPWTNARFSLRVRRKPFGDLLPYIGTVSLHAFFFTQSGSYWPLLQNGPYLIALKCPLSQHITFL